MIKKLIIVALVAAIVAAFWIFDLQKYFTLEYVKSAQSQFMDAYQAHPVLVMGGYMLVYILVTGFSLPGAVPLSLAGGALFGLWLGVLLTSFASTIGATLACFLARFVLRDWVQGKFGDRLEPINRGIAREGAFYLFSLRLVPIFPFFVINLVFGLTSIKLWTFYWVSQLGMLPASFVFINAGKELGQLESLGGILTPSMIISFVLLGIFPIAAKKILNWVRLRRGQGAMAAGGEE
jgi:uncharacterized membrane protein YdjX (TVP38/TMEM64 family)